jgi:hypothetical protein
MQTHDNLLATQDEEERLAKTVTKKWGLSMAAMVKKFVSMQLDANQFLSTE